MGNSTSTRTHTCLNPYPCSQIWVLVGMGMGTRRLRGCQNPCRFGPQVPRESTRQRGDDPSRRIDSRLLTWQEGEPPCHVGSCFSTWQGGDNPPHHINSHLLTWQGGRNPPCHIGSCFLTPQGGRNPPSC